MECSFSREMQCCTPCSSLSYVNSIGPWVIPDLSSQRDSFKFEIPNYLDPFYFSETRLRGNPKCGERWVETLPAFANKTSRPQDNTFVSLLFCHRIYVQTNPWPWLKSTAERLVAREILVTRDATKTAFFSSLCIPVSSLRAMLWIVLSTLSHLVCLSVADGAIASESWFPGGRDSRACYYSCVGRGALPNQVWMLSDDWIRAIAAMLQDFGPQSAESVEETVKQDLDV